MAVRHARAGFTAPELLNMLVVGGILAAIIYGQPSARRAPAVDPRLAPMRSALVDLRAAQLRYHGRTGTYTTRLDSLDVAPVGGITRVIDRADSTGWHATASAEGLPARCEVGAGATVPDTVVCGAGPPQQAP